MYAEDIHTVWEKVGYADKLAAQYREGIEGNFFWENIHAELDAKNPDYLMNEFEVKNYGDDPIYGVYVGSVFAIFPSGKFWDLWAYGNMEAKEMVRDTIFDGVLTEAVEEHGLFWQTGEGDATDIFFCKAIES